jgi:competence protein ComEA
VILREWVFGAAIVATLFSPVVPAIAGSLAQDQSSNTPQQNPAPPDAAKQEEAKRSLPAGEGRDELIHDCSGCHLLTVITTERKSESDWTDTVINMRSRGANASDEDLEKIVEYLAKNFAPQSAPVKINVNTNSASDIAAGLSLSQAEAQAIVDYRDKNGKFKDLAGLKQVPGAEADKIDAMKDRIEF